MYNDNHNKKGQFDLIAIMIVFTVFIIAAGFVWFVMSSLNTELLNDPDLAGHTGPIEQSEASFTILNWGSVTIFVFFFISLLISFFRIGSSPYWLIIHIVIVIIAIILSGTSANMYYDLTLDPDVGSTFSTKLNLPAEIMYNYPMIIAIIGFVSIIVLVGKWSYDSSKTGGSNIYSG